MGHEGPAVITDPKTLLHFLPDQRWFGHKGNAVAGIELIDEAILSDGPPALVIAIVAVNFEGENVYYQLPLLVDEDGHARDATQEPDRMSLFGELLAHGDTIKGTQGAFHFAGPGLDPLAPPLGRTSVRVMGAEQSNTSIVLDEQVILKFFRRVNAGVNPDLELNRLLTNEGFDHIPAQVGEITYEGTLDDAEVVIDLAIAQQFLVEGTDAWEDVLKGLHTFYGEADPADASEDRRFLTEERAAGSLEGIAALGDAIASMHIALARDEAAPELVPEPMTSDDVADLRGAIERALTEATAIAELHPAIRDHLETLIGVEVAGHRTRVHGDLHLGQVMATPRGWMILDFEGEPLRSLEERRAKQSPLKDVAGMLRSFNYAAVAALFERAEPGSETWERLEPWAECWEALARERFLTGYLTRAHEGRFLPTDRDALTALLAAYEIEKALYELAYEESHRPEWVRIPVHGIRRTLEER
jgi:trehalose synthase-fused probable maltokinase